MKILVDKYIPYLRGVVEPYAEVAYLEPEEFTPDRVHDADALLIRTRTKANAALLEGSRVRLVATATIGYDHIDTAWCEAHGIAWTNAPGCNAQAVCDYIEASLPPFQGTISPKGERVITLGVVGVGHVGSLVVEMAKAKGFSVLENDPPKGIGVSLEEIARQCDIITFHTPMMKSGQYPTYHLCNEAFLAQCRPGTLIINAARGGIVDEHALLRSGLPYILDTWEGEPNLNREVLAQAQQATYHIAGYSIQGKVNASNACLQALSRTFGLPAMQVDATQIPQPGESEPGWIERITAQLKAHPERFEVLRESYALR